MRAAQVALLGSLAWRFPGLRPALDEHLDDNEGEILPHPLMAAYERWLEARFEAGDPEISPVLASLEEAYATGGEEVQELIAVSFLEHLPRSPEPGWGLREHLGPAMTEQLRKIG